jgi:3-hydroxyacyl-CoA dehydrogenase, NAD binding domain
MIGCGSMGGGMALLFAENGLEVSLSDASGQAMDKVVDKAKKDGFGERIKKFKGERMFSLHYFCWHFYASVSTPIIRNRRNSQRCMLRHN